MIQQYTARDVMLLDETGGYYARHVEALTAEKLHNKSSIAAELAFRDATIDELREALKNSEEIAKKYEDRYFIELTRGKEDRKSFGSEIKELRAEVERLEACVINRCDEVERLQSYERNLRNLLSVVHRDGGHNESTYGPQSSTEQAISKICDVRVKVNFLKGEYKRGMLDAAENLFCNEHIDRDTYEIIKDKAEGV